MISRLWCSSRSQRDVHNHCGRAAASWERIFLCLISPLNSLVMDLSLSLALPCSGGAEMVSDKYLCWNAGTCYHHAATNSLGVFVQWFPCSLLLLLPQDAQIYYAIMWLLRVLQCGPRGWAASKTWRCAPNSSWSSPAFTTAIRRPSSSGTSEVGGSSPPRGPKL